MRLSDYENEEALDLIAEIIEPASVIMSDKKVVELLRDKENPVKSKMRAISYALKEYKAAVLEIIAALHRTTVDKLKVNTVTIVNDLLDILNDPEIETVFSSQGQTSDTSGSATENTGGDQ